MTSELLRHATEWAEHDPDPKTAAEIAALVGQSDEAALAERFTGPLAFGTAGLRGEIGAGETRMNLAVVTRATAGLVAYLKETVGERPRVVVGCDARHGSAEFQRAVCEVVAAAGGEAIQLEPQRPTPVTAFAVKHLQADAGVMVTASHNPPRDNGYKVYLGGRAATGPGEGEGVQIVPPADAQIAEAIAAAPFADEVPRDAEGVQQANVDEAYLARLAEHTERLRPTNPGAVKLTLTPMHGVGGETARKGLTKAGFTDLAVVDEQWNPDPDFPTVNFPNPEEPGALDLAMATAERNGSDLIIALDPDADRCALAIPAPGTEKGWRQLTGDETGALLSEFLASKGATGAFASSIVSGRLIAKIAKAHGLDHQFTLTGFKWIARTPKLSFGYEEAIGYCCDPTAVRDKDGISAAVTAASLAAELKAQGKSFEDALDDLARHHGLHATAPLTFRVADTQLITDAMARLRANPPEELAGAEVTEFADLADGYLGLPPTEGVLMRTEADDRVVCRPSGTEPKLKCYLEVVLDVDTQQPVPRADAAARLDALRRDVAAATGMQQ